MKHDPLSLSLSHLVVYWGSAMDFGVWFVGGLLVIGGFLIWFVGVVVVILLWILLWVLTGWQDRWLGLILL